MVREVSDDVKDSAGPRVGSQCSSMFVCFSTPQGTIDAEISNFFLPPLTISLLLLVDTNRDSKQYENGGRKLFRDIKCVFILVFKKR
jgi:hypothetical protein